LLPDRLGGNGALL